MTISCAQQIDLSVTPYYHCINHCVRRAFFCGEDRATGKLVTRICRLDKLAPTGA